MKNLYIAMTRKREDGKMFSFVYKTSDGNNLASIFKQIPDLLSANVWPKNVAERSVAEWNRIAKEEDKYFQPANIFGNENIAETA